MAAPEGWSLKCWRDDFWVSNGRRYELAPDADLRAEETAYVKQELDRFAKAVAATNGEVVTVAKVTTALITNVIQAIRGVASVPATIEQPCWLGRSKGRGPVIAVANGLVDLERILDGKTGGLRSHSFDWFSPVCLEYGFDPSATCPRFLAFLGEILEADQQRIHLVQEWFGLCLIFDTSFHRFLVLVGDGANGKSVLLAVLTALLGADNVSHVPLEFFGKRFQLTATLGRLANIVPEFGSTKRMDEGVLKAFVAGDRMFFDRKNLPPVHARPTARLAFATNQLPRFHDQSEGVWRRMLALPVQVVIPPERQDRGLVEKLNTELPGIFNWSLDGLRRLRQQGAFTEPDLSRVALDDHRRGCNSARDFLAEQVVAAEGGPWRALRSIGGTASGPRRTASN